MNNSTMNDENWVNVSGLPEMPSLVRIDKEAIVFALIKLVKIANRPQQFHTGKWHCMSVCPDVWIAVTSTKLDHFQSRV